MNLKLKISILSLLSLTQLHADNHLVFVGSGIVPAVKSLFAYYDSINNNIPLKITIFEKNDSVHQSTATQIAPSLTPDEILSVIPRGQTLIDKSQISFKRAGGIRVQDVPGMYETDTAQEFMKSALSYGQDEVGHEQRTQILLSLGKLSMTLWQNLYEQADDAVRSIFHAANFNPCKNTDQNSLHEGYRIDLIYNASDATSKALGMKADYESLGYDQVALLTPAQVIARDASLEQFCKDHADFNEQGELQWHNDAAALWRPGGCLDASVFIPQIYGYLQETMGMYTDEQGNERYRLEIYVQTPVNNVEVATNDDNQQYIKSLHVGENMMFTPSAADTVQYAFCPGSAVGTLRSFGFTEPSYAGFAGASLRLNIPLTQEQQQEFANFNHCMEVHQEGVVLAWQARLKENHLTIAVGDTKAFYADQTPNIDQEFAHDRNLLQLNMINQVVPHCISIALQRNTHGQQLTEDDLATLVEQGIAQRWVGTRAVAYDGFPTIGQLFDHNNNPIVNAYCMTHLGSGGVSFAPATAFISRAIFDDAQLAEHPFVQQILTFAHPTRTAA